MSRKQVTVPDWSLLYYELLKSPPPQNESKHDPYPFLRKNMFYFLRVLKQNVM